MYSLRSYQQDAVKAALSHDNGVLVLPTGSGKSLVIASIVSSVEGNSIVLQPTKEILESNLEKIQNFGFEDVSVFSASMGVKEKGRATYATIGSIIKHLDNFKDCKTLIIDEAHLVNAKGGMYDDFIKAIKPNKLIGLTATPYRLHTTSFGSNQRLITRTRPRLFKDILHVVQTRDLTNQGYLVEPRFLVSGKEHKDLLRPNTSGAEYSEDSINKYITVSEANKRAVNAVKEAVENGFKHILVFTPSLTQNVDICVQLSSYGIVAVSVDGKTPKKERERIINGFKSGEIQAVVNVGVLTTGFDFPALDCIVSIRPTMSLSLYYQMIGRCVRPHPEKRDVVVYDLVDNYENFTSPFDMTIVKGKVNKVYEVISPIGRMTGNIIGDVKDVDWELPFGKYNGTKLSEVPSSYLEWGRENMQNKDTVKLFDFELIRREIYGDFEQSSGWSV